MTTYSKGRKNNGYKLGGGIQGFIPKPTNDSDNTSNYAMSRLYLRESYNTNYGTQETRQGVPARINTPFRLATNAGDPLSRKNYSCGGAIQSFQSRPGMFGLKYRLGHNSYECDGTGIPASSGNGKYVYDSSDYTRYRRQFVTNKNYNDLSNGGNDNSSQQVKFRSVRRF